MSSECARCRELEQKVAKLTEQLASERERSNALFVAYPPQAAPPPPPSPAPAPEPKPIRQELAELARRVAQKLTGS